MKIRGQVQREAHPRSHDHIKRINSPSLAGPVDGDNCPSLETPFGGIPSSKVPEHLPPPTALSVAPQAVLESLGASSTLESSQGAW